MRFNKLKVKEIVQETPDCVSVEFDLPQDLEDTYRFKPGQYLTFKHEINGEELRRSYSLCSAPYENKLKVAVKKVENGRFSTFVTERLNVGDELELMKPMGRFVSRTEAEDANLLFFAAGSGITPIISIIKDVLYNKPKANVTLVYGNKGFDHIIFREELEGLRNTHLGRFRLFHVLSREVQGEAIFNGRIDLEKCGQLFESGLLDVSTYNEAFVCGPESMIQAVRDYLGENDFDANNLRFELFTSPGEEKKEEKKVEVENDGNQSDVVVVLDGVEYNMKLATDGDTILDAASAVGADLPYACKGGVCCTCKARVTEGKVSMDVNYSLEQDEIEQGFVLTCQSHPITDKVVVDFDSI